MPISRLDFETDAKGMAIVPLKYSCAFTHTCSPILVVSADCYENGGLAACDEPADQWPHGAWRCSDGAVGR